MEALREAMLLRVFVGATDRHSGHALFRTIVEEAHRAGLEGATVFSGPLSFGHRRHLNTEFNVDTVENLPMVVEIVDSEARLEAFLLKLEPLVGSGLLTLEKVRAGRVGRRHRSPLSEAPRDEG
jgi:uncharacterized protein